MFKHALISSLLVLAGTAFAQADAAKVASYSLRLPIEFTGADSALQRLALPAQALISLKTSDYSDLRVFNAQGQAVPMALIQTPQEVRTERQAIALPAFPIYGESLAEAEGFSLKIEAGNNRVIQLNTQGKAASANKQRVIGMLLDARKITAPVTRLDVEATIPAGQAISFELQTSSDLKAWRSLGTAAMFKAEGGGLEVPAQIALAGTSLKDQYLRISWDSTVAGIEVKSATLQSESRQTKLERVKALMQAAPTHAHTIRFELPFATPLAGLQVQPTGSNSLIPLRVLGRNDKSQPWTPLASAVVYQLNLNGKVQSNSHIELGHANYAELSLEADAKTPGFAQAPNIELVFEPVQLVFVATGQGPFELAAGLAKAPASYLPISSLMPGYKTGDEAQLKLAQLKLPTTPATATALPATEVSPKTPEPASMFSKERILWGVLLLGVALMALMAWSLMKNMKKP